MGGFRRLFAIVIYLMLAILYAGSVFAAQAPGYNERAIANFYRGKTGTIVVGHSAGGGFDRHARAIARHFGKYIPGGNRRRCPQYQYPAFRDFPEGRARGEVKLVTGFKGTAEIRLAMQSGEVNSVITGWETLGVSNYKDFESGEWLILSQWVDEPLTDLPQKNVPSIYQYARNDEERQMLKLGLVKPNSYARPYAMPPGVPLDRVRAIQAAFLKSLKDPEFVAEAEKTRMTVSPIAGTDLHSGAERLVWQLIRRRRYGVRWRTISAARCCF